MGSTLGIPEDIVGWIGEVVGGTVSSADRMAGGGRKQAWFVDVDTPAGVEHLFLRWDPTDLADRGDPWTVRREAEIYRALDGTGLPVARFVGLHPTAQAMLVTRSSGTAWFSRLRDESEREQIASEFMGHLAALHRLDPRQIGLLDPARQVTVPDLVREQLAEFDSIVEARGGAPEPMLQLALDWLRTHVPTYDGPIVLVQGDTGPGNFMFENGRVTAIVDWELAHLGDPMDDLAWVSLRATQEPFTDLRRRFAEYEQASGHCLDADRIRYYRVLAEAKILVMNHGLSATTRSAGDGGGPDPGARLIFGQLHRRLCAEALADVMGIELDEPIALESAEPTESDELFEVVLGQLRDVVTPRVDDSFAGQRIKGLARALKYLAASSRHRTTVEAAELSDLRAVLGGEALDLRAAREAFTTAVRERAIEPDRALPVVYRSLLRRNELLRESSGVLADRHYEPLES